MRTILRRLAAFSAALSLCICISALSVLADGINEKLFDAFSDSVLTLEDQPALVEDYIQDLKEMVHP